MHHSCFWSYHDPDRENRDVETHSPVGWEFVQLHLWCWWRLRKLRPKLDWGRLTAGVQKYFFTRKYTSRHDHTRHDRTRHDHTRHDHKCHVAHITITRHCIVYVITPSGEIWCAPTLAIIADPFMFRTSTFAFAMTACMTHITPESVTCSTWCKHS